MPFYSPTTAFAEESTMKEGTLDTARGAISNVTGSAISTVTGSSVQVEGNIPVEVTQEKVNENYEVAFLVENQWGNAFQGKILKKT
jgi:hypothetical protein